MICTSMRPLGIERAADGADPPVHHVGRRDDVAARLRLDDRLLDQHLDGLVVEDLAVPEQAVMAVAGIGIERDVAQDADIGHFLLDGADGAADEVVRIERLGCRSRRAGPGRYRGTGRCRGCRSRAARSASRTASSTEIRSTPGIEPTGMRLRLAIDEEQRPDQVVGGQHVLPHHAPGPLGFSVAAVANGEIERRSAPPRRFRLDRGKPDGWLRAGGRTLWP